MFLPPHILLPVIAQLILVVSNSRRYYASDVRPKQQLHPPVKPQSIESGLTDFFKTSTSCSTPNGQYGARTLWRLVSGQGKRLRSAYASYACIDTE
jgi:hypothetical protein